jgi:hypothetical protein
MLTVHLAPASAFKQGFVFAGPCDSDDCLVSFDFCSEECLTVCRFTSNPDSFVGFVPFLVSHPTGHQQWNTGKWSLEAALKHS